MNRPPSAGELLLPWGGAVPAVVALLFLVAYARHETQEPFRGWVRVALFGTGGLLLVAAVADRAFSPRPLMAGPGAVFGVLGLLYLGGYFAVAGEERGGVPDCHRGGGGRGGGGGVRPVPHLSPRRCCSSGPAALLKLGQVPDWGVILGHPLQSFDLLAVVLAGGTHRWSG